ncbi:hypothetical protein XarjCFBP7653_17520 [Xanthomonas arboricola]|uniref:hypothetical protein n=1 Tax=Xanthomonas TaxID=338 RepID=UPI000CEEB6CE|nr:MULTISPECIES: hypothetical protein [Xanthomonas]MBB3780869.1 hypothetical protein [Xanthomonas euroxanthea]NIK09178.1 hypothetical protein [Xanthomonas euroxanthea]PPT36021.1 hypothetical protein XarjCFBP7653_17520 [Xanthomonas arboricola]
MSYDTQETPASAARQIAQHVGLIANTFECSHTAWLSRLARPANTGKAVHALTFADCEAALAAVDALHAQVRR